MSIVTNKAALDWVNEMAAICEPDEVEWITGDTEQLEKLKQRAISTGEMIELNQEKLPGCLYYRTEPWDVARDEKRTLICTPTREEAGPTNHWKDPEEMYAKLRKLYTGAMKGRPMYVIPYSMCVPGTSFARYAIEITDSIYVVLSMNIMTHVGMPAIEAINNGAKFVKCMHSKANMDKNEKWIVQFPQDMTVMSVNSAYGGNVLLGKKCFALRLGSYLAREEGWMAEHMFLLKIITPYGEKHYIAGAFPSACGKTNMAMLTPPERYIKLGYKVETIGDDIVWMHVGEDGRLYAANPENGFFGVAPGMSMKTTPNAFMATKKNSIFTNVARNLDDNTVWWQGMNDNPPENGEDWTGKPWNGKTSSEPGSHPNSRFTSPAANCPSIAEEFFTGQPVPLDAIIFGGRRAEADPLVYEARDWNHGVFIGATMTSRKTAAADGKVGEVRHDPMAMIPFCGYNMSDYFQHWIDMGKKMTNPPKIFHVNWFRTDEKGHLIWPGFSENFRVLMWMLYRCRGKVEAQKSALGYEPYASDFDVEEFGITHDDVASILTIDKKSWEEEIDSIDKFFSQFDHLPKEIEDNLDILKENIASL